MDAEELRRRQAKLLTARELALRPKPEAPEPTQRQAQNITREQTAQELTASNDNAAEQQVPTYMRRRGESEMQFEARVARLKAQDAPEKEETPKHEMHLRPKGPMFGR